MSVFPIRLRALLACCAALVACGPEATDPGPQAVQVSRLDWVSDVPHFGGFSGLELSHDGRAFMALADDGAFIRGILIRTDGKLTAIEQSPRVPLVDDGGAGLLHPHTDAEGLALARDGSFYVSFEAWHRVWHYPTPQKAVPLSTPGAFNSLGSNSGLEALAIDAEGRLYTLPERSGRLTQPFPVWRHENGRWREVFSISRSGGFSPVGADFGPDGRLYLLERSFSGFAFRSRVRRFTLSEDRVIREETLFRSPAHQHGNLEGLSVWRDDGGAIRLTMIADNNFIGIQRNEIVEYRVIE
ncbi:esterase-like activity of phytase family protein [Antarctobacter jejuensis]|uniref:esterase-like activity of phytase family protein n=1 Tax=Antarctobacter jejuensis TaxID=1439938 RepID=UPI003FD1CF94